MKSIEYKSQTLRNIFTLVLLFRIIVTVHTGHNVLTSHMRTLRHRTFKKLIPSHTTRKETKPGLKSRPHWPSNSYSYLHTSVSKALWRKQNAVYPYKGILFKLKKQ